MELGLKGRKALVTAASRGLGRACAESLAREGAEVFIASRDEGGLADLNQRIGGAGYRVTDVSEKEQVEALVNDAVAALEGLDILVVNAGGAPPGKLDEVDDATFENAFHLTTMSAVWLWRNAIPHIKKSKQGRIVNITSAFVKEPSALLLLSNAFRPGVTAMAKMLSAELAPLGFTVHSIGPNAILPDRPRSIAPANAARAGTSLAQPLARNAGRLPSGSSASAPDPGRLS